MKTNYHTHTTWCDGKDSPETVVLAAIEKGELADHGGESELAPYLRSGWTQRPGHGFFFRAEFEERFATQIDPTL